MTARKYFAALGLISDILFVLCIMFIVFYFHCSPKYAVAAVKKKLYSQNPHQAMFALLTLESIVKNCGMYEHDYKSINIPPLGMGLFLRRNKNVNLSFVIYCYCYHCKHNTQMTRKTTMVWSVTFFVICSSSDRGPCESQPRYPGTSIWGQLCFLTLKNKWNWKVGGSNCPITCEALHTWWQ